MLLSGTHQDKIFRMPGAYRHLVTIAKNVRVAAVHTSNSHVRVGDDGVETNSIDEDIVYDDWSYNRQDKTSSQDNRQHTLGGNNSPTQSTQYVTVEQPVWRKAGQQKDPSLSLSMHPTHTQTGTHTEKEKEAVEKDYPFSSEVERMWESKVIPKMLYDIYSECSSPAHMKNIALLPTSVIKTIQPSGHTSSEQTQSQIEAVAVSREGLDVEGLRISFSLCASTYATTLLDHLVITTNKKHTAQL